MNKKSVQWLYKELSNLVKRGVLSQSAADKLREYYGESKTADKKWFVLILCGVLGALLIGLGIILLFGHNWSELSRPVRAILSLLPLIVGQTLAIWTVLKRPESQAFKEGAATFLSLMVGSSIALISQTYNIPGDTPAFILTWMLLIVPLAYLMDAAIPAAIFVAGVSAWTCQFWHEPLKAFLFWPLVAIAIPHFIWSLRQEKYTHRAAILALVLAIGVCVGAAFTLSRYLPGSWIVVYSGLAAGFYLLGAWEFKGLTVNWQRPFQILGGVGSFILMFMLTFKLPWESITGKNSYVAKEISYEAAIPNGILAFLLLSSVLALCFRCVKRQDWMRTLFGVLPLLALIGYAFGATSAIVPMLLFNVYLLAVSTFRLMMGIRTNNLGVINTGMLMLSALILARFFDSEINFVLKGLTFVFIGVGFLAINIIILRRKEVAA